MTQTANDAPYAMVVDDDFLIRSDVSDILQDAGFRVHEAEHGDDALEQMQRHHDEVVLLFTDVNMPGSLDGFALARAVDASWPHVSIVIASGHARPGPGCMPDKARFIGKPFSAQLVHDHIQEILPDGHKPAPLKRFAQR